MKYPGFLQRCFGSTLYGETVLMCGVHAKVHEKFGEVQELNHRSSVALRSWSQTSIREERMQQAAILDEISEGICRRDPGAGVKRKRKGKRGRRRA